MLHDIIVTKSYSLKIKHLLPEQNSTIKIACNEHCEGFKDFNVSTQQLSMSYMDHCINNQMNKQSFKMYNQ